MTTAEEYLREKYGAYRGHYEWRALEEAFNAGKQSQRDRDEQDVPRVVAFLEQLDKRLEAAGYTHAQRLEITGLLLSNKIEADAQSTQPASVAPD